MKVTLPIIGQVRTGKDLEAPKQKLTLSNLSAGFVEIDNTLTGDKTISDKLLKSFVGWVYANVSVLAEEISKMEFELYQIKVSTKGEVEFVRIDTHPLLDLLDRFNPFTTISEAMYMTEAHLELAGDTFYLLDKPIAPTKMFILQPDRMEVEPGEAEEGYNIRKYKYRPYEEKGRKNVIEYDPDYIIQIKNPNPNNPYRGKSVVEAAANAIDIDNLAELFLKQFFTQGAVPNFALSSDQRISEEDIKRMQAEIKRNYGGFRNAFKAMVLGGGLKPVSIQQTGKEMQLIEIEQAMRDKIMALFKNTKASLGIVEDVNRANAEATLLSWKQSVIKPKMQRIVDTLNEFLVPRFGDNLLLTFEDPVPEDEASDIAKIKDLMAVNTRQVITVNEAREMLDLDPIADPAFDTITANDTPAVQPIVQESWPKNVSNVDYKAHFRRLKIYDRQAQFRDIYKRARDVAERLVQKRLNSAKTAKARKEAEAQKYSYMNNTEALEYWSKLIQITEVLEDQFAYKIDKFILALEERAIANLHNAVPKGIKKKVKAFDLFDEKAEVQAGIDLFTPLVEELATLSGSEAYKVLNVSGLYNPSANLRQRVARAVEEFTQSFIHTDREKLTNILTTGLEEGQSIAQIERAIRDKFGQFRKEQTRVIARTETLRASSEGSLDAYKQSGVVQAKQWLTAPDCIDPLCLEQDGRIVGLSRNFFDTDYGSGQQPPLHPNCRCVLLPVLDGSY